MLARSERDEIARLWNRKLEQDRAGVPQTQRHRNLEPPSAEFLAALAAGVGAKKIIEIGGSTGISTIALASAARETGGRLISIEMEAERQAEARGTLARLQLDAAVDFVLADAADVLPCQTELDLALIDCEKEDYIRFFDMLPMRRGGIVVADNILSHSLWDYVKHVRAQAGVESITFAIGKGLEVTRV